MTKQLTVHAAKTNPSKVARKQRKFKIGLLKDELTGSGPDFFEPMAESELEAWEGARLL
jgi:hypothetical protein